MTSRNVQATGCGSRARAFSTVRCSPPPPDPQASTLPPSEDLPRWISLALTEYFRCYSPVAFPKKYDKDGAYVRRWLPQLKAFPSKYIYEPWLCPIADQKKANCIIGQDYPKPIVDHTAVSKQNMDRMAKAYAADKADKAGGSDGGSGGSSSANGGSGRGGSGSAGSAGNAPAKGKDKKRAMVQQTLPVAKKTAP